MKYLLILLTITSLFTACREGGSTTETTETASTEDTHSSDLIVLKKDGITLTEVVSPVFPDASLTLQNLKPIAHFDGNPARFEFQVENYELGSQTADADVKNCANSGKGQHIHLILNNEPYTAHYESSFSRDDLEDGNYDALAFLSRSYHESVKSPKAYELFNFSVGIAEESVMNDPGGPRLFYSRPKGLYEGDDIKKVLLDFYLVNTDLSADGNKVRATINGTEFMLDKWVPYAMEGLSAGEVLIELALLNNSGELVRSPFNPVTRVVNLVE